MKFGRIKMLCKIMGSVCMLVLLGVQTSICALELDPKELRTESVPRSVSILQNRFFAKSLRPELSLSYGLILNEAYLNTQTFGVKAGMFFTEFLGVEVEYFGTQISDSNDRKNLSTKHYRHPTEDKIVRVLPDVVKIKNGWSFEGVISPFYGKINFFDQLIIYSDINFSLGVGKLQIDREYAQEIDGTKIDHLKDSKLSFNLGIGERFYIKQFMSIRVNLKDRIFDNGKKTQHSIGCDFGLSYFFL